MAAVAEPLSPAVAPPARTLPVTIVAVTAGAAVYFAGAAAAPALSDEWGIGASGAAALTWATQAGFIVGTLATAALNLPDRVSPARLVAALLVLAAAANALFPLADGNLLAAVALRFVAGAIAGPIYPVGMKFLATWYPRLGRELGILLGFYAIGAGIAFALRAASVPWQGSLIGASVFAVAAAGLVLALLRPGPLLPAASPLDLAAAARAFRVPAFRASAFAYFGHMWELFAFWALLPFWLAAAGLDSGLGLALAAGVFVTGGIACAAGGFASTRFGEARVARVALASSGALCVLSPLVFDAPAWALAPIVLLWGAAVAADSPMFSAISARSAPRGYVGTALTVQNSVGFAVTIGSIALLPAFVESVGSWRFAFLLLAPGPLIGLPFVQRLVRVPA